MRDLNKSLIFMFLLVLGLFILSSFSVVATGICDEGFRVNVTDTEVIDCHDPCKKVTNGCSDDIFVPTKTPGEWDAFIGNTPGCVSLDECNDNPVAEFTFSPSDPVVNEDITFDASSSYDPDGGDIEMYKWDFNNDNIFEKYTVNPITEITHFYDTVGSKDVNLKVKDDEGNWSDIFTKTIQVSDLSVTIEGITISDVCPTENTHIEVNCSSDVVADCVIASLEGDLCTPVSWSGTVRTFDCTVGSSTTTSCQSGNSYTATCYVDETEQCTQSGNNKTAQVWSLPSDCSDYAIPGNCDADSDCEWCDECNSDNQWNTHGEDICVDMDQCSYSCDYGNCGAECDSFGGCGDSYYCNASTQTYYHSNNCLSNCTCSGYTEEVNNAAYCGNCSTITCGDGEVNCGEECDDGNTVNTDSCLNDCSSAGCGDGYVWSGNESCDDGNSVNTDSCLNDCSSADCGDGYVWSGEEDCDDGNTVTEGCGDETIQSGSFCNADCNAILNLNEDCESGNLNGETCASQSYYSGSLSCSSCSFNTSGCYDNCSLLSVDVNFNGAGPFDVGDSVAINGSIDSGSNCSEASIIQVDANSSDGSCHLEFDSPPSDMSGINSSVSISAGDSSFSGSWNVPSIPSQCAGETVDGYAAALWSQDPNGEGTGHLDEAESVSGSVDFGIPIDNCQELQDMCTYTSCYSYLTQDIDCSGITRFDPIGIFKGTFDGRNHTISNIETYPYPDDECYLGLFSKIEDAVIKNVVLKDIDISNTESLNICDYPVGAALVAEARGNSLIYNCGVESGQITMYEMDAGGLVANLEDDSMVSHSFTKNLIMETVYPDVGAPDISAFAHITKNNAKIQESYSAGCTVTGAGITSGFIGYMNDNSLINNSYVRANNVDTTIDCFDPAHPNCDWQWDACFAYRLDESSAKIQNSYSACSGSDGVEFIESSTGISTQNYCNEQIADSCASMSGCSGRTTANMTHPFSDNTYVDWDFTNVWKDDGVDDHYPCLKWQDSCMVGTCGDGSLETDLGEECDDGNNFDYDSCTNLCQDREIIDTNVPDSDVSSAEVASVNGNIYATLGDVDFDGNCGSGVCNVIAEYNGNWSYVYAINGGVSLLNPKFIAYDYDSNGQENLCFHKTREYPEGNTNPLYCWNGETLQDGGFELGQYTFTDLHRKMDTGEIAPLLVNDQGISASTYSIYYGENFQGSYMSTTGYKSSEAKVFDIVSNLDDEVYCFFISNPSSSLKISCTYNLPQCSTYDLSYSYPVASYIDGALYTSSGASPEYYTHKSIFWNDKLCFATDNEGDIYCGNYSINPDTCNPNYNKDTWIDDALSWSVFSFGEEIISLATVDGHLCAANDKGLVKCYYEGISGWGNYGWYNVYEFDESNSDFTFGDDDYIKIILFTRENDLCMYAYQITSAGPEGPIEIRCIEPSY